MISKRYRHAANLLSGGGVLVTGGSIGEQNEAAGLDTAEFYDPATGVWTAFPSMSGPRQEHSATVLPGDDVVVAGGRNGPGPIDLAEIYLASSKTWEPLRNLNEARMGHSAMALPNGDVLVVAGNLKTPNESPMGETFSKASRRWTPTGPVGSWAATATLVSGSADKCGRTCGKVLVVAADHPYLYSPESLAKHPKGDTAVTGSGSGQTKARALGVLAAIALGAAVVIMARRLRK